MTPLERLKRVLDLREPDMVPVVPIVGYHSAIIANVPIARALGDGREMARLQLKALREYGYDGAFTFMDLAAEPEALGCRAKVFDAGIPMITEHVLPDLSAVGGLEAPEPRKAKRLIPFLDAVRSMREDVDDEYMVSGYVSGPITLAGNLAGSEGLYRALIRKPEEAMKVIEFCTEFSIEYGRALESEGAHAVAILEPSATSNILSPKQFERFSLPYLQRIVKSLKVPTILHICGDTTQSLSRMVESGARALSVATIELDAAKKEFGSRICLMGNVPTIEVLLQGRPGQVTEASRECIREAAEGGGFILSSGCDIPPKTSSENVRAMVKAARTYGRYPLNRL